MPRHLKPLVGLPSKHSGKKTKVPKEVWRILTDPGDPEQTPKTLKVQESFYYIFFNCRLRKCYGHNTGFPGGSVVKNPLANAGDMSSIPLGQKDPLEKELATHCSILAWEIPRTEEPGGLQSMGWQKSRIGLSD